MKLDDIDKQLILLLQTDSKKTTKSYSNKLGLSVTAVYERIKRLEKNGVIKNYVALIDKDKVNLALTVFCRVKLVEHTASFITEFEQEILTLNEVIECHHIGGDFDYLLKIYISDMDAYRKFMVQKLTAIDHIGSTQSSFAIKVVKHSTVIPL